MSMFPDADPEDLTNEDIERSHLASGMSDDDLQAVYEDAPLEDERHCPHDGTTLQWVDDAWRCPKCGDEFHDEVES